LFLLLLLLLLRSLLSLLLAAAVAAVVDVDVEVVLRDHTCLFACLVERNSTLTLTICRDCGLLHCIVLYCIVLWFCFCIVEVAWKASHDS
jgi:hypothetical protein